MSVPKTFSSLISINILYVFFLYKKHLYKELEAEKGSKNKEFLRNYKAERGFQI